MTFRSLFCLLFLSLFCREANAQLRYQEEPIFSSENTMTSFSSFSNQKERNLMTNLALPKQKQKQSFLRKAYIPAGLITLGLITMRESGPLNKIDIQRDVNEAFPDFQTKADDYTQLVPIIATYGLQWAGVEGKNDFINKSLLLIKAEAITLGLVHLIKYTSKVPRPDTGARTAFPSGHTSQAFVAATFMHKEYGHKSVWYSIGAYSMATATGVLRVMNNRHYLPDVLVGAGMGILITELVYHTHQYKFGNRSSLSVVPAVLPDYQGIQLSYSF